MRNLAKGVAFIGCTLPRLHDRAQHLGHTIDPTTDEAHFAKHVTQGLQFGGIPRGRRSRFPEHAGAESPEQATNSGKRQTGTASEADACRRRRAASAPTCRSQV
ncbi:MAG: hypothetical protein EOP02_01170 [Proteobacteria bacterium]|nr:MAG: hypothetical protein EOP02_01170 [Pseudomonadota bacterium]